MTRRVGGTTSRAQDVRKEEEDGKIRGREGSPSSRWTGGKGSPPRRIPPFRPIGRLHQRLSEQQEHFRPHHSTAARLRSLYPQLFSTAIGSLSLYLSHVCQTRADRHLYSVTSSSVEILAQKERAPKGRLFVSAPSFGELSLSIIALEPLLRNKFQQLRTHAFCA